MKLYIDIDGVLLKLRDPHPADYAEEFISYIVEHFDCYLPERPNEVKISL